ncbi:bifunctional hydroxymethylpyrimidine kinase/phosphomethylpyrimidine kinase [Candidatus Pacearchaeota archaeon]|nr:bifunctional hydroxymethylpyrimidine kinase/phosphomethylpyrimidine kinase [Candidatus Pacearchaeota archaeon]
MNSSAELINIIKMFAKKRIAVIGDLMLDSYVYGAINRLNPESAAPLITLTNENQDFRLGGAGNTAMNALALGAKVDLYGVIGKDFRGRKIEKICKKTGINLTKLYEGQTIEKKRLIEIAHGHYLMRVDSGETNLRVISQESEEFFIKNLTQKLNFYDGIILSDYNKRLFKGKFGQKIIDLSNLHRKITVVDPKPINAERFLKASLVRPNLSEAKEIVGKKDIPLVSLAKELKKKMQSNSIVITLGSKGLVSYDNKFFHFPANVREVSDVSGAGDTLGVTLLLSLISGANLVQSAKIANFAAGIVVEKQGTSTLTTEELINRIKFENITWKQ